MPLQKIERTLIPLKGKTVIDLLFEKGKQYKSRTLLLRLNIDEESQVLKAGVTVSKKNFSRAVDRNRIKRVLRVALKELPPNLSFGGQCMLIYTGREMPKTAFLVEEVKELFEKI
ncbi:MAG: ribonuclease P protein component [Flavobacteriaceae bacterium]